MSEQQHLRGRNGQPATTAPPWFSSFPAPWRISRCCGVCQLDIENFYEQASEIHEFR